MKPRQTVVRPVRNAVGSFLVFDKQDGRCYGSLKRVIVPAPIGHQGLWHSERWMIDGDNEMFSDRLSAIDDLLTRCGYQHRAM